MIMTGSNRNISEKTPMLKNERILTGAKKPEVFENNFQEWSDEVKLLVFNQCDIKTLGKIARICKDWRKISEDKTIWNKITLQEIPNVQLNTTLDGRTVKRYLRNTLFLNNKIFSPHQTILKQLETEKIKKPIAFSHKIFYTTGVLSGVAGCAGGATLGAVNSQWFCCDMFGGIAKIYSACICSGVTGCSCTMCGFILGAIIASCVLASDKRKEDARCEQATKIYEEKTALFKEINAGIANGEVFVKPSVSPVPALQMK